MEILYHDDDLIVVNKPSGLLSIQDGYHPEYPYVKSILEQEFGRIWVIHRLDKETSGILLLARNATSHRDLNLEFQNRIITKNYHAIVHGIPEKDAFSITEPLLINGDRKHRTIIDRINGKPSRTDVELLDKFDQFSLLSVSPKTGYTHQIRSHLAYFDLPIVGDHLYTRNKYKNNFMPELIQRTALHAYSIQFIHPKTKELLIFSAKYPDDFTNLLFELKKESGR